MKLLILFVSLVVIHAIYNLINFLRYSHIENLLIGNYTTDVKLNTKAKVHKNEILNYINRNNRSNGNRISNSRNILQSF